MSFRRQLAALFLLAGLAPLLVGLLIYSISFDRSLREAVLRELEWSAEEAAHRIDDLVLAASRGMRDLASDERLLTADPARVARRLAEYGYVHPFIEDLHWVGSDGRIIASSNSRLAGESLPGLVPQLADDFAAVRRGAAGHLHVSGLEALPAESGVPAPGVSASRKLHLLARVDDSSGAFGGILIMVMSTSAISHVLRDTARRIPGALPALLLDAHGNLLVGEAGASRAHGGAEALAGRRRLHGDDSARLDDWQVLVQATPAAVTTVARRSLALPATIGLALLAMAMALALLLARAAGRRVAAMTVASQAAAGQQFRTRLPAQGADELAQLARAFNAMLDEVQSSQTRLEAESAANRRIAADLAAANRHLEDQYREISLRNELGNLLQSCLDADEAGAVIARYAPRMFPGSSGALYVSAPGTSSLSAVAHWGPASMADALRLPDCWAVRRGKPYLRGASATTPACSHLGELAADGASLCVPLQVRSDPIGLLHVVWPAAPDADGEARHGAVALAEALASQVATTLASLRVQARSTGQPPRDALTGLGTRSDLDATLDRLLAEATTTGAPVALLAIDVDGLKSYCEAAGRAAGDEILRALGTVLHEQCGASGSAFRFGGDTFAAVLPGTTLAAAREWVERLRGAVRRLDPAAGAGSSPGLTISIGLALYPLDGHDRASLLKAANLALYDAKQAGGNRLVAAADGTAS